MFEFYTLHFDGSCGPKNPGGTAAYGYTLAAAAAEVDRGHGVIGSGPEMSNNVGEYAGLVYGLQAFADCAPLSKRQQIWLQVRGDSQLVINQMSGKWKARAGLYYPWYESAAHICKKLRKLGTKITFDWVPRELNQECDDLSKINVKMTDKIH
jgi:ribonuclease HI